MFNIFNVSVPMPMLLPTEIEDGISDTNISVVNPADGDAVIVDIVVVVSVVTPILNELFKTEISVDNPDILTISLSFKLWFISVVTFNLFCDHVITELLFSSITVSIDCIGFPEIFDMKDIKPSPPVPSSSNFKNSPTL